MHNYKRIIHWSNFFCIIHESCFKGHVPRFLKRMFRITFLWRNIKHRIKTLIIGFHDFTILNSFLFFSFLIHNSSIESIVDID